MIVPMRRLAVFVIIFVVLSACAAPENSDEGSGDGGGPAPGDAIKIGVNIELSGPAGVQGAAYQNAVELVAAQINETGVLDGQQIELIIRDNKSDPTEALQVAKGMIENDNIAAGRVGFPRTSTRR